MAAAESDRRCPLRRHCWWRRRRCPRWPLRGMMSALRWPPGKARKAKIQADEESENTTKCIVQQSHRYLGAVPALEVAVHLGRQVDHCRLAAGHLAPPPGPSRCSGRLRRSRRSLQPPQAAPREGPGSGDVKKHAHKRTQINSGHFLLGTTLLMSQSVQYYGVNTSE